MNFIKLDDLAEHMKLKNLTPMVGTNIKIHAPETNRPALQLTGYFEHFENKRVQVIGNVEVGYMASLDHDRRNQAFEDFVSRGVPCVIFTSGNIPDKELLDIAAKYGVPIFGAKQTTTAFTSELIQWMYEELAPMIAIHAELVDVFGEGVLITGESGIGKSEAALELIKRGHRLISDDIVQIKKVSDSRLIGTAPEMTKYLIELRGIGVIDVKTLFGVESVEEHHPIDLCVNLIDWSKNKDFEFDRLGMKEEYTEYLGNKVVKHTIPVRPGRNLAVIIETAALNWRQKKMGYNAAEVLYQRVQESMMKKRDDD